MIFSSAFPLSAICRFALRPLSKTFILIRGHLKSSCHVWNTLTAVNNKSRGWGILGCTLACGLSNQKNRDIQRIKRSGVPGVYQKMNLSHISSQRATLWRKTYAAFFYRRIMPYYTGVGGGLGVLWWIRHEPFHIAAIALRTFQYQLMEFHTTDADSCWWKAYPNYAGRNSILVHA